MALSKESSINDVIAEMLNVKIGMNPYGEDVTNKAYNAISNAIVKDSQRKEKLVLRH